MQKQDIQLKLGGEFWK